MIPVKNWVKWDAYGQMHLRIPHNYGGYDPDEVNNAIVDYLKETLPPDQVNEVYIIDRQRFKELLKGTYHEQN